MFKSSQDFNGLYQTFIGLLGCALKSCRYSSTNLRSLTLCLGALIFIGSLLFSPDLASAQPAANDGRISDASVGTLVAAVMETIGYVSQAKILNSENGLGGMLQKLGALIYIGSILSALLAVALAGRYDVALWLLVGPPMFNFLIAPPPEGTNIGAGAEWHFGAFTDADNRKDKIVRGADVDIAEAQKVSWFFHAFNVVVSDMVQQFVKLITNDKVRQQMLFMTRQHVLEDLFAGVVDSPDLFGFAAFLNATCSEEMDAARIISLGQRDPDFRNSSEYKAAVKYYCDNFDKPRTISGVPKSGGAFRYLKDLKMLNDAEDVEIERQIGKATCKQMWSWMLEGMEKAAKQTLGLSLAQRVYTKAPKEVFEQIVNDINTKMTSEKTLGDKTSTPPFQCAGGGGGGVTTPNVSSLDSSELVQLMFSAWMVRKVFSQDSKGQMLAQFAEHANVQLQNSYYTGDSSLEAADAIQRRFRVERMAEVTKYETYTLAMTLPYVQGAGLYVLATLFPFFALLVLIPGQAGSFFMWCALWVWLKSWDIGWALVMVADELLWSLMPHAAYFNNVKAEEANPYSNPITIFEAAFNGDYGYNLSSYYMLLAAMITAVPILTANAVLGSKKAVAGILVDGMKTMGTALGVNVSNNISADQITVRGNDFHREQFTFKFAARELMANQVDLLASNQMWRGDGVNVDSSMVGGFIDRAVGQYVGSVEKEYTAAGRGGFDRAAEEKSAREFLAQRLGSAEEIQQRLASQGPRAGGTNNKFRALAQSRVRGADGVERELGNKEAMMEVLRQAQAGPMFDRAADAVDMKGFTEGMRGVAEKMGLIGAGEAIPQRNWEFVDNADASRFADPLTRTDYRTAPSWEFESLRRSMEYQRSLGDYMLGASEMVTQATAGSLDWATGAAVVNPVAGAIAAQPIQWQASLSAALHDTGTHYSRSYEYLAGRYQEMSQKEYAFNSTNTDTWRFYDNIRAGTALREEWWNSPDAPADNRAMAHYTAVRQRDISTMYLSEFAGKIAGNPTMAASVVGGSAADSAASWGTRQIGLEDAYKRNELNPKGLIDAGMNLFRSKE